MINLINSALAVNGCAVLIVILGAIATVCTADLDSRLVLQKIIFRVQSVLKRLVSLCQSIKKIPIVNTDR